MLEALILGLGMAMVFEGLVFALAPYRLEELLEAMAQGCAIVATDVGDTRRLLDDSCALLVEPSTEAICEAAIRLLLEPALLGQLSQASLDRVRNIRGPSDYGSHFLKLLPTVAPEG